jgi:hypothetical protein
MEYGMKKNINKLLMLSAMYENGGNTTHRFLDGHPELFVYPFESQVGTRLVNDFITSMFPQKYRWPEFKLSGDIGNYYESIIDEECKIRTKTPKVSKFRDHPMDLDDKVRKKFFIEYLGNGPYSRGQVMMAFFFSTFEAWKDYNRSGNEKAYVGYSPCIIVDADRIINDLDESFVLHVIRNPFSAYADTKKRAVPLSLKHYITAWVYNQYNALYYQEKYPGRVFVLRFEDIIEGREKAFKPLFDSLGIELNDSVNDFSWNGKKMENVYPWGTIRIPTKKINIQTANELTKKEKEEIRMRTSMYLNHLNYDVKDFM